MDVEPFDAVLLGAEVNTFRVTHEGLHSPIMFPFCSQNRNGVNQEITLRMYQVLGENDASNLLGVHGGFGYGITVGSR